MKSIESASSAAYPILETDTSNCAKFRMVAGSSNKRIVSVW